MGHRDSLMLKTWGWKKRRGSLKGGKKEEFPVKKAGEH